MQRPNQLPPISQNDRGGPGNNPFDHHQRPFPSRAASTSSTSSSRTTGQWQQSPQYPRGNSTFGETSSMRQQMFLHQQQIQAQSLRNASYGALGMNDIPPGFQRQQQYQHQYQYNNLPMVAPRQHQTNSFNPQVQSIPNKMEPSPFMAQTQPQHMRPIQQRQQKQEETLTQLASFHKRDAEGKCWTSLEAVPSRFRAFVIPVIPDIPPQSSPIGIKKES